MRIPDLREILENWPYDPERNVRQARIGRGRELIVVRLPMGLEQYELDGRPDGSQPNGSESLLEFQLARLAAAKRAGAEDAFRLTAADCRDLFGEAALYYRRFVNFFHLKDWARAERDTDYYLRLLDFVKRHAEHEEDRVQLEQWRPDVTCLNTVARTLLVLDRGQYDEALEIARGCIVGIESVQEREKESSALAKALSEKVKETLAIQPEICPLEDSAFVQEGDYWTIHFQGRIARFKATRGMRYLALLLRYPGREFHVCEMATIPLLVENEGRRSAESGLEVKNAHGESSAPLLDPQAKADYRRRVLELREELDEARRLGDQGRADNAEEEMNAILAQLSSAFGLGGRERKAGSSAERARSSVTQRIKKSIKTLGEAMPFLGRHLAERITTGYFCSYSPHPERPVHWRF